MRARLALVGLAASAVLTLSACSPPAAGLLGLTVRDGRLLLLAQACNVAIDVVWVTGDDAAEGYLERERVILDSVPEGLAEYDLGPLEEFTARLDPEIVYSIRGRSDATGGRAPGPAVTAAELTGWGDDVLYPADGVPLEHATGTVEEFAAEACD